MKLTFNKSSPLGVKDQIKHQIKGMIESGRLRPGARLPSSRDLALTLGVNRNTAWSAYRELTKEGWLSTSMGSGTYVSAMKTADPREDLGKLFDELMAKAQSLGYEPDEVADRFMSRLACQPVRDQHHRLLIVECNHETGIHIAARLEKELRVRTQVMLIQDIEKDPRLARRRLNHVDLVVCGFSHLEEFRAALPDSPVEAVGLLMQVDWTVLEILNGLPAGTRVGLVCANARSTRTLFRDIIYHSGSSLRRIWAGMDDEEGVSRLLETCPVVLASHYVYERVIALAGPHTRVGKVDLRPDPAGVAVVRRCLKGQQMKGLTITGLGVARRRRPKKIKEEKA